MKTQEQVLNDFVATLPCASDDHYPMSIRLAESEQAVAIYGTVRTDSHYVDGCGGRTDLHDMLAALWAVVLRANGVASSRLVDFEGFGGRPELSARWVIFDQPSGGVFAKEAYKGYYKRFLAHTAWAYHQIADSIGMQEPNVREPSWQEDRPPLWVPTVRNLMNIKGEELYVTRQNPNWRYYTANGNALSIIELEPGRAMALRLALVGYDPKVVRLGGNHVLRAGNLVNAVSSRLLSRGNQLLKCVEGGGSLPWRGLATRLGDKATVAIPMETHCAFLGSRTVVVLKRDCGHRRYLAVKDNWRRESSVKAAFLNLDANYTWSEHVDAARFEELIRAILQEEPGFEWVRGSGHTFERDGGRDLVAHWMTPPAPGQPVPDEEHDRAVRARKVVVQVKARNRTVGKSDVRDIRDTVERHRSEGFFLAAVPCLSSGLVADLERLREQGYWVEWWSRVEIEDRLRGRPDFAGRFQDLVRLEERM